MKHEIYEKSGNRPGFRFQVSSFRKQGISLIEVVVVVFIATVLLFSISQVAVLSFRVSSGKKLEYRAVLYLNEGLEAMHAMRDESWDFLIDSLTASTTYYLVQAANSWTTEISDPGKLDGIFDRTIVLQNVYRNTGTDDIDPGGALDPDTKRVTVTMTWDVQNRTRSLSLEAYITNYLQN